MLTTDLLALLRCPRCHGQVDVREDASALDCLACRLRYRVDDGIPVMLVEEAEGLPAGH
jgi:uncharacterized protein YbaR (Trm112 family)